MEQDHEKAPPVHRQRARRRTAGPRADLFRLAAPPQGDAIAGRFGPAAGRTAPEWVPAENLLSLIVVLFVCFLVGAFVRTTAGQAIRERLEKRLFEKIPGYALLRSMTQQLAGSSRENVWKPALVEIEDGLCPAFVIEELDDGQFTVFVPSVPTPMAGAVYVFARERVHLLDVSFTHTIQVIGKWGSGSRELVAAMKQQGGEPAATSRPRSR